MFARLFGQQDRAVTVDAMWGPWGSSVMSSAGVSVTRLTAMQLLAVYGSVQLIVNEISTLPVDSGAPWVDAPPGGQTRISWLSQIVTSMALDGTAFLAVIEGSAGVSAMVPLDPETVTWQDFGDRGWKVGGQRPPFEIVPIPCMVLAGQHRGLSPLEFARQSIGLGLAAQEYGSKFFGQGEGDMPGVIEDPKPLIPGKMKESAELWQRKRAKGGRGLPGYLDDGKTWKATGVTNEQAQFLATRNFTAAEIAGQMYMVDPSELGIPVEGSNLTYANLAQRNTRRITFTCMPYIRRIEAALAPYARGEFRFNVDARLRGDTKTSYETLAIALDNGFMTLDEIREVLNLPSISGKPPTFTEKVEMVGQLIRAGFDPEAACAAVGLPSIPHTGLTPVTVTPPVTSSQEAHHAAP